MLKVIIGHYGQIKVTFLMATSGSLTNNYFFLLLWELILFGFDADNLIVEYLMFGVFWSLL